MKLNKYQRIIEGFDANETIYPYKVYTTVVIDIYDVLKSYEVTCPAVGHAIKKLLCPGQRGHKSYEQDLREARVSIDRALQMAGAESEQVGTTTQGE